MSEPNTTNRGKGPRVLWAHVVDKNGHYIAGANLLYFVDGVLAQSIHLRDRPCRFEIDPPETEVKFIALYDGRRREEAPAADNSDCRLQFEDVVISSSPPTAADEITILPQAQARGERTGWISWLHLTDLHFNTDPSSPISAQRWLWPGVREEFFRDLDRVQRHTGPWDLVFFSGDLAQSGTAADYQGLGETLEQLWGEFKRLQCQPMLLAVPGNHDLEWPEQLAGTVLAMRSWTSNEALRNHFWSNDTNEYRKLIQRVFGPYKEWWDCQFRPSNVSLRHGLLPGDFSASYQKDGLKLGIVGLNSAFLQLGKGVREGELLDLDPRQLHAVCEGGADEWAKAHDVKLLMTHHPPSWLNQRAQDNLKSEIAPSGRFDLHLFGHMHEPQAHFLQVGGGGIRRDLQGASLFGLENWETPQGRQEQRIHGYTAGRIDFDGTHAAVRLWPRKLIKIRDGSRRMGADIEQGLNEEDAIHVVLR